MKPSPKPFRFFLKNSKTHSLEFVVNIILSILPGLPHSEAKRMALRIHNRGKAQIVKGSRKACRDAARIVREAGEDRGALRYLNIKGQGPMKTAIVRN